MKTKLVTEPFTALIIPDGRTRIYHTDEHLAITRSKKNENQILRNEIPIPAKDVFLGRMSSLCRQYAEQFYPNNWFILSTNNQKGQPWLVHPDQPIKGEYDNPPYPIPHVPKDSVIPSYWQPFISENVLDEKILKEAKRLGLLPKKEEGECRYSRIIFLGNFIEEKWWSQLAWDACKEKKGFSSWFQEYEKLTKVEKSKDNGRTAHLFAPYVTQKFQYSLYVDVIRTLFKNTGIWLEFPLLECEYESQMISRISDAIYRNFPLHQPPYSLKDKTSYSLRKITIKNLFRMHNPAFNYTDIPLGNNSSIQIITAPNGYGKSTIFRLLRAIFKGNLSQIYSIPFDEATITLASGSDELIVSIDKKYSSVQQEQKFSLSLNTKSGPVIFSKRDFDEQYQDLERWKTENMTKVHLLRKIIPPLPIRFLSSERLFHDPLRKIYPYDLLPGNDGFMDSQHTSRGEEFEESFRKRLDGVLTDYAIVSHKIDTTFPIHLLENVPPLIDLPDDKQIKKSFADLDKKRQTLEKRAFLSFRNWYQKEKNPYENKNVDLLADRFMKFHFLKVYLEEQGEKYKVFDWMNDRCDKFEKIINNMLASTQIRIRRDKGFSFYNLHQKSGHYHELDVDQISSGEMQQIVMYYDFLFNCDPGTLVLIDEPEISLHIVWQEQFIENLQNLNTLTNVNFLVATHSPYIISSFPHLAYDLEGDAYVR
jgi:predicted ATPase